MNTQKVPAKSESNSFRSECSIEALSERLFERSLTFRKSPSYPRNAVLEHRERGQEKSEPSLYVYGSGDATGDLGFAIRRVKDGSLGPKAEDFSLAIRVPDYGIGCDPDKKAMLDDAWNLIQFPRKTFGVR